MDAAKIRTFLREEFGIRNDDEFEMAVNASAGIDIGLFTQPFEEGVSNDKKGKEVSVA